MKKYSFYFLLLIIFIPKFFVLTSCANIIPPTGGPRDSLPPVLINALPKDSTLNFKGNRITLTFDEYVQLDNNLNDMLIVSPNPGRVPTVEGKLREVTIKLKDSLRPNTTYSFNFGRALKDVNENNVLKNFEYVFSTGDKLADGSITGNVKIAQTGVADSTLLVVLHYNLNDSAIEKLRPDFYTRLDSSGNFTFRYLPAEKFAVYVIPNDYSKKYDDSTKMFAFYDGPVEASATPKKLQLYAYDEYKLQPAKPPSTSGSSKKPKEEDKRLRITTNLEANEQDLLDSLELTFDKPIIKFDSTLILFTDTLFKPLAGYTFMRADSSKKKFALIYKWPENEYYKLVLGKEAFADSAGIMLAKADTLTFKTRREGQYGSIRLHFINLDLSKNPVLQLVQNNEIVQSVVLTGDIWTQKLFKPGQYDLRILYDKNKNGVWDHGSFKTKTQPEVVDKIRKPITTKANWDNEVDINL